MRRSAAVYEYVLEYHRSHGYGPSLREISSATGIASTASVHWYVERLVADGMLRKTPGIARSYRPA